MRKDWNPCRCVVAYAYSQDDVGILQEKLVSFAMGLTMHLVQQSENQKVDQVECGAAAGSAADPHQPGEPTDKRQCARAATWCPWTNLRNHTQNVCYDQL